MALGWCSQLKVDSPEGLIENVFFNVISPRKQLRWKMISQTADLNFFS